ncbi:hypothetical protein LWI28_002758 [Acer negundo]|uniref:Uncharacterized protein n=1 Tax=Acer negundo TaxID=4023 RepID=A0AAD5IQ71_ACENE|nr:hypothetical protein LWI28_002758 [Acer negundo]
MSFTLDEESYTGAGSIDDGAAWLSSARVVRCLVKSYNERNPRFVLLRHAPKEKVFATELAHNNMEMAFLACLVKSSFWPYLAGDDDVELVHFLRTYYPSSGTRGGTTFRSTYSSQGDPSSD